MPYIKEDQREKLDKEIEILVAAMKRLPYPLTSGVPGLGAKESDTRQGILNYVITRIIDGLIGEELKYSKVNDVVGALECCKLELYRRLAAPYEDTKIKENGDAYVDRTSEPK